MAQLRKSYPRFKREGDAPAIALTEDDIAILEHVHRHRFVRADDLYRLFPGRSSDKLSRRLVRLFRNRYLDRPIAQIDRHREGGSAALVYGLDSAGARHLKEHLNVPVGVANWKARNRSYTRENLDHTLAVATFMIDLELACRANASIDLIPFEEILRDAPPATRQSVKPGGWPVPLQYGDASGTVHIVPDAIFGLRSTAADGRKTRAFVFLEIDRGTMTIAPAKRVRESDGFLHRSSVLRKLLGYAASHHHQLHKEHLGIPIARVLTLTNSVKRAAAIREVANALVVKPLGLPSGLFLFGVAVEKSNPLATAWTNAASEAVRLEPT